MKLNNLELHIEELVLHGFAPGNRYYISQTMEREPARLVAEQGAPPSLGQGGEIVHLNGGAFEVAPGATVEVVGVQVAQAV